MTDDVTESPYRTSAEQHSRTFDGSGNRNSATPYDEALYAAEVACDQHYEENGPDGHVRAAIEVFQNHLADYIAVRADGWGLDSRTVRYLADEVRSWGARWDR